MSQLRVLVVGASIAGPTAAYWFAKAGAKVTVIERFPKLRTGGQNIDIRTAGVTVMRKMTGMEAAVRNKVVQIDGLSFVDTHGGSYGVLGGTGNPDQQSLLSEFEIFRGDLAQILVDLTKDNENIQYVFDEQVAAIRQNEDENSPVTVEFANHLPTSEYDLVVACDGATSRTRAIGFGCGVRDHIDPINSWVAYYSTKEDLLQGSKLATAHSAIGGRFICLAPDSAASGNRAGLMGIHPRDSSDATLPFREAMKQGDQALRKFVFQHFEGAGWKTDEMLKDLMDSKDFYASEMVQVNTPSLNKGRFVLVGDAGYGSGPSGGGTTLALAGAYVLAGEICKHKGDLAAGLQGYEQVMRPLINDLHKIPPLVPTCMAPQTAWGIWLRNWIFAAIAWSKFLDFGSKYLAPAFAGTDKYPLPDYEWVA